MTTSAWILLLTVWSLVAGMSVVLIARVLNTPPKDDE